MVTLKKVLAASWPLSMKLIFFVLFLFVSPCGFQTLLGGSGGGVGEDRERGREKKETTQRQAER